MRIVSRSCISVQEVNMGLKFLACWCSVGLLYRITLICLTACELTDARTASNLYSAGVCGPDGDSTRRLNRPWKCVYS